MAELKPETILQVLELVYSKDVRFCALGGYDVCPEGVLLLLQDPESFMANVNGVSLDIYRAWQTHDMRCRALTRRGHRCKNRIGDPRVSMYPRDEVPPGFNPVDDRWCYCETHQVASRLRDAI